jgi:hypothetical protein
MGVLDTKMEKYLPWRKWYPRMCVYDDVKGWNTLPYLQANFIWNLALTLPLQHLQIIL